MIQPDLFTPQANYRNTDPATSREAAIATERNGEARSAREKLLRAVEVTPGLTAAEYAALLDMERHVPSRRLPELRELRLVWSGRPRVCKAQGRKSMTWWPGSIPAGEGE
jgi:hypothetical protein